MVNPPVPVMMEPMVGLMALEMMVGPATVDVIVPPEAVKPSVPPVIAEKLQSLATPKEPSYDIVRGTAATNYEVPREHGEAPGPRVMGVAPTTGARPN